MKLGFFELDITPVLGSVIPGYYSARIADEILDPLYVRAFAVQNGTAGLAVASVDCVGITGDITQRIRDNVAQRIPLKPEEVMIMGTHAHGGGPVLSWGEFVVRNEQYLDFLVQKIADSIVCAYNKAADSELLLGKEELYGVSFIRDYRMKDGTLKTNPGADPNTLEPLTAIDPEVTVLAVRQKDVYVGAIINFANHPAIVATTQITGDYISALSSEMKRIYGPHFVTVFINGACGNINHIDPFDPNTQTEDRHLPVGAAIAQKSAQAIQKAVPMTDETLCAQCDTLTVHLRKPDANQLSTAIRLFQEKGDDLCKIVPGGLEYKDIFFAYQAFRIASDRQTQRKIPLQIFRIGSCYIFGTPIQMYVQYGKKLKAACQGTAFVSAFANDYCGYVPTPDCIGTGIYEARLASTSCLEANAGDMITDKAISLYEKCK